ncbi:hypothetical protein PUNSTDRAFT_135270 [Punctularia strigosozonata HHB-11173 SS5]|uniref:uncharacterized protein n=1 Tax=Punctularia strigosozonata (strain HHB-11173) TaxID=741275 RepID=UPI0004416513|nr:uncharacterized protein PUNSTDRAFT_135270 [Punctularia strigosozonata HHB-11173 SS5]EIN07748.1 hypothetical protein PUNSTDRAFT_135270 [Punctularia strigosozonata HHB-11173 SS5]
MGSRWAARDEQRRQIDRKIRDMYLQIDRVLDRLQSVEFQYPPWPHSNAILELEDAIPCLAVEDEVGIQHLDDHWHTIGTLCGRLRSLFEQRNQLAPASLLPNEILSLIFRDCVSTSKNDVELRKYPVHTVVYPYSHVFSHVCQHWRRVALGLPGLWSNVPRSSVQLTEVFLSRSRGVPLMIENFRDSRSALATTVSDEAEVLALSHLGRAQTLDYLKADVTQYQAILSGRAPVLVSCKLHADIGPTSGRLPHNFLGSYAPHLRSLDLARTSFDWVMMCCPSLFRGLTSLQLVDLPADSWPTAGQLVAALRTMPLLQELCLETSSGEALIPMDACSDVIVLRNLTKLFLGAPVPYACVLLERIRIPSCAIVFLELFHSALEVDYSASLVKFLEGHCTCNGDGPSPRTLCYGLWDMDQIVFWVGQETSTLLDLTLTLPDSSLLLPIINKLRLGDVDIVNLRAEVDTDGEFDQVTTTIAHILSRCSGASEVQCEAPGAAEIAVRLLLESMTSAAAIEDGSNATLARPPDLLPLLRRIYMDLEMLAPISEFHRCLPKLLARRSGLQLIIEGANELSDRFVRRLQQVADRPELVEVSTWDNSEYNPPPTPMRVN